VGHGVAGVGDVAGRVAELDAARGAGGVFAVAGGAGWRVVFIGGVGFGAGNGDGGELNGVHRALNLGRVGFAEIGVSGKEDAAGSVADGAHDAGESGRDGPVCLGEFLVGWEMRPPQGQVRGWGCEVGGRRGGRACGAKCPGPPPPDTIPLILRRATGLADRR